MNMMIFVFLLSFWASFSKIYSKSNLWNCLIVAMTYVVLGEIQDPEF
jgi:hypothetical protein